LVVVCLRRDGRGGGGEENQQQKAEKGHGVVFFSDAKIFVEIF